MNALLVGIGNTLRRDDGAGWAAVQPFANHPGCRVLTTQQLVPELIPEMLRFQRVAFADASLEVTEPRLRLLSPRREAKSFSHTGDAAWLLSLSQELYSHHPQAVLLEIPAHDLGYGEGLSQQTQAATVVAVELLHGWLTEQRVTVS